MPVIQPNFTKLFRTVKGQVKKDYHYLFKELRKIDKTTLKGVNGNKRNFTPQQKAALSKRLNSTVEVLKNHPQKDLYILPKRKGESGKAYNKRIDDLKEKYRQGGTDIKGVFIHRPSSSKSTYRVLKDGTIKETHNYGKVKKFSIIVPPSVLGEVTKEGIEKDIKKALKMLPKKAKVNLSDIGPLIQNSPTNDRVAVSDLIGSPFMIKKSAADFAAKLTAGYKKDGAILDKSGEYTGIKIEGELK